MTRLHPAEGHAQIDALTRGVRLPMKPMRREHLRLLAEGIRQAWAEVKSRQAEWSETAAEASLNAFMETELKRLRQTDPVWRMFVAAVSRGGEAMNYDGTLIEKRPDLSLELSGGRLFPLIVECKLIDAPNRRTPSLYCSEGIARFVRGDYAWAVQESFMLAYVRDGSACDCCLFPLLASPDGAGSAPYGTVGLPDHDDSGAGLSVHDRSFRYPTKTAPEDVPGPITLWHLWLN